MDVSSSLEAVFARRSAEHAERAAAARDERRRKEAERAANAALLSVEEADDKVQIKPAETFNKLRRGDIGHLVDITV